MGILLKVEGQKQQEKGPLGYGIEASFCRQTWGKVSAMFSQIKDVNERRKEEKSHYTTSINQGMDL